MMPGRCPGGSVLSFLLSSVHLRITIITNLSCGKNPVKTNPVQEQEQLNMQMNHAQQQAVHHKDGPMLVLAGPGSGKTLVITERTKVLIKEFHISEENILVITFSKAAASEMKERFLKGIGASRSKVNFGTFHAVFYSILRHAYHLGAENILREEERFHCMKEILRRFDLEYEDEKELITELLSEISLVKGNRMDIINYYSINCADEIFRSLYREYNSVLRRTNKIDFDDMLLLCYELLAERKDILKNWQNRFRYILIDEFQDINQVQYDIIKMLGAPENNLFAVGDDDQSIYRFRGAKPEIMLHFPEDYPGCTQLVLPINYRSAINIVQASGRLINHNQNRFQKESKASRKEAGEVNVTEFNTMSEQNQVLANEILKLNGEGVKLSEIAVLVRTNLTSGPLLRKLMEYNIPFRLKDSLPNLYDHFIAQDILTYIRIALGNRERGLFLQIMNRPKRYLSRDCLDTPEVDLEDIKAYYEDKNWMLERIDQLEYDLALLSGMGPYAAVNYIRRGIGYEDYLKEYAEQRKMKVEELQDILDELQENAKEFKTYREWFRHIEEYREELKRQAVEGQLLQKDSLTVATMHSSKGLEYRAVFIMDTNEGIIPHKKAALPSDIEEERRLFYVAMTRARDYLYIYNARERYNKVMLRSRFIGELLSADKTIDR